MMAGITERTPASATSCSLHSHGTGSATTLTDGIPLLDEADLPSFTKPSLASATAGLFKSSTETASWTRNFVQDPQSPTESTTASLDCTHASNFALPSVSASGVLKTVQR